MSVGSGAPIGAALAPLTGIEINPGVPIGAAPAGPSVVEWLQWDGSIPAKTSCMEAERSPIWSGAPPAQLLGAIIFSVLVHR